MFGFAKELFTIEPLDVYVVYVLQYLAFNQ
jgi:hypothetical protein